MTAYERYAICKQCLEFNQKLTTCNICRCFMVAKVHITLAKCPLGKW